MAQFDVHRLDGGALVVDCQSDYLDFLKTRLTVPLLPAASGPKPLPRLNPVVKVLGRELVFYVDLAAAVPIRSLGEPVASLRRERDALRDALDMIIVGF